LSAPIGRARLLRGSRHGERHSNSGYCCKSTKHERSRKGTVDDTRGHAAPLTLFAACEFVPDRIVVVFDLVENAAH
jgi:hypothetical protein